MSREARGEIPRKFLLAIGLAALAVAGAMILKAFFLPSKGPDPKSSAAALTPRGVDGTVGGPGSQEYNQMIDELNRAGAELARESGESFVATPTGSKSQAPRKAVPDEPKTRRPVLEMPPQPQARPARAEGKPREGAASAMEAEKEKRRGEMVDAMVAELESLPNPAPGPWVVKIVEKPEEKPASGHEGGERPTGAARLVLPGQILYAVTGLAVNSDVPSPVLATVVQGDLAGWKLLGSFQRDGELLSISFAKMVAPCGAEAPIKAVAVDSRSNSPAVSGQVDRHSLERWGALMAASFLEGLGGALSGRGTSIISDGEVIAAQKAGAGMGEISLEALGKVGERAAERLGRGFDRPPTVVLPSGAAIGALIIEAPEESFLEGAAKLSSAAPGKVRN